MTIPHGITIGGLHTYNDLHLIPACRPIVQPPMEKTLTLDIEGMSGVADLSHGLTGYPIFYDREGSWQFFLDTDACQEETGFYGPVGEAAYLDIQNKLTALMKTPYQTKIILDDEPQLYYLGRVWVSGKPTQQYDHAKITLQYRLYPYKYLVAENGGDWLWDTFCFESDLATVKMQQVELKAGQEESFPLLFTDKPAAVFVTSTGKALAKMEDQNGANMSLIVSPSWSCYWIDPRDPPKSQTEAEYPIHIKDHDLRLQSIEAFAYFFKTPGKKTATIYVRKAGSNMTLASGSAEDVAEEGNNSATFRADIDVLLEAHGNYIIGVRCDESFIGSINGTATGTKAWETDYFEVYVGEPLKGNPNGGYNLVFGGGMSFYAGGGAVLRPGEKTNIGIVGTGLANNGRSAVIRAEEDTVVDIGYRPAYL